MAVAASLLVAAAEEAKVPLDVSLRFAGSPISKQVQAKITLTPPGGTPGQDPLSTQASVPGTARFEVPPRSAWQLSVEAPGTWSLPRAVVAGSTSETVDLLPAGRVRGEVRAPAGQAVPVDVTVRFRPAPGAQPPPFAEATAKCPVIERRFDCAVPAGALDLRVRAPGFVTHSVWGAMILPGRAVDLGILQLRPGASIVGWIEAPAGDFRFQDCKVEATPVATAVAREVGDLQRRDALSQKEVVNSRGFFELSGLSPGSYTVVVRHPAFAPARISPVEVIHGAETEIQSIALQPPIQFEARIQPAMDPHGRPWQVALLRHGVAPGHLAEVAGSAADAGGVWRARDLEPGRHVLSVKGSFGSRWASEDLVLSPGMAPYDVTLPFVDVEGQLRLGDEPLEGIIWFGGRSGAVKVAAQAAEDGSFSLVLPVRESWRVEVYNQKEGVFGYLEEVEVRKAPGHRVARVLIELPDNSLSGEVVDEQGRPVPGASLNGNGPGSAFAETESAEDGRFELRALRPGRWGIEARDDSAPGGVRSAAAVAVVGTEGPGSPLRLVLRSRIKISGQVVGPGGDGVPGAQVFGRLESEGVRLSNDFPTSATDVAGRFELAVPAEAQGLQLTVLPPGFAVRQLRIDARRREPLIIPVHQLGGLLVLDLGSGSDLSAVTEASVFHDYLLPGLSTLLSWRIAHGFHGVEGGQFAIPMLEPGRYTACAGVQALAFRTGHLPAGTEARCVSGELPAFGELVLKLPKAPAEEVGKGSR